MSGERSIHVFARELGRRKVWRVAISYISAGLAITLATAELYDDLFLPDWTPRLVLVLVCLGLPVALVLAWAYEVRPERPRQVASPESEVAAPGSQPGDLSASGPSIVVLPFENMSSDASDAFLADGIAEEITADLVGIEALRVISRTSASQYRNTTKDTRTIARELSVRYVLEGSVRKAGDQLRITAQLIDAPTDTHLWAKKYPGTMAEIFGLQERVSRSVVEALGLQLDAGEDRALAARSIPDVQAFELYVRARQEIHAFTGEGLLSALGHLHRAREITGDNAPIFAQLGYAHYQLWNMGVRLEEEDLRLARAYGERALAVDPDSPEFLVIAGLLEVTGGSAVRGLALLDTALRRNPSHPDALAYYPGIAAFLGLAEQADEALERLDRVDPLNPFNWLMPMWREIATGDFATGLRLAEEQRALRPGNVFVESGFAFAAAGVGRTTEAADAIRAVWQPEAGVLARLYLAVASAFEGDRDGVLRFLDPDVERWARKDFEYSLWIAEALALVGEGERASDWLENSVERGNINHAFIAELDPFLSSIRGTARFGGIAERARVGWERWHAGRGSAGAATAV